MTTTTQAPQHYMQGIQVAASSVRPEEFFRKTRRHILQEKAVAYAGQNQDVIELRKSDILAGIVIRFSGQVVIAPGTGAVATTARWPYDFLKTVRFTANGASNIINCSGLKLKARDIMKRGELNDRGVSQLSAGVAVTQGTLALGSESWGVGSNTAAIAAGTYPIELEWFVPVAEDENDLAGAVFLATSTADLTLTLDYENVANLFTLTGNGTAALTGTVSTTSVKYSVPLGPDGEIVVPNLNVFHSLIQSRYTAIQNGENEVRIVGQGAGKSLLRVYYQLWNGAAPANAPLKMNAANFGKQSWRYGNNETPDELFDGTLLRQINERVFGSDLGGLWGFGVHDFAAENAFRDVVDMGAAGELRIVSTVQAGVVLASPALEYVTETIFAAGQAA
jgi:hypothetical protein